MRRIEIAGRSIGEGEKVFIIAEAGVNYKLSPEDREKIGAESDIEVAYQMIDAAKDSGADAIKFQSFSADELQYKGTKKPNYQDENVGEEIDYYEMLRRLEPTREEQLEIARYCKKKGILFMSTPYDKGSADFLDEEIDVPMFKLASIELNNHLFTKYVARKGKPVILSTGLSEMSSIEQAVEVAKGEGYIDRLILLQCTSDYPAHPEEINLNVLKTYKKKFPEVVVGLSDHSPTDTASIGAVAIGASVLEKHFTLSKEFYGPDHSASLNVRELRQWVERVREIEDSMGSYEKYITESEKRNLSMRKYLIIGKHSKGTKVTESILSAARTGGGILPLQENLDRINGKNLQTAVEKRTPLTWDMIGE